MGLLRNLVVQGQAECTYDERLGTEARSAKVESHNVAQKIVLSCGKNMQHGSRASEARNRPERGDI